MSSVWLILAFSFGFLLIFGLSLLMADFDAERKQQVRRRLDEELRLHQREKARGSVAQKDLYELAAEGYVELGPGRTLRDRLVSVIDQSGTSVRPAQLAVWSVVLAVGGAGAALLLSGNWFVAAACGSLASALPFFYVSFKRWRRQEKLLSQLPDAFELMSRVLRSGQTISQSMQAVADEFARPIAEEFSYCWEQQNLGLSPEAAMRDLARRTGLLELKMFVVAMMVHRQTGGNMAVLLEKLAKVIRDRYRIRGHIKALTAEGRLQAYILLALPPAMLVLLSTVNPTYMRALYQYPALLGGMFTFEVIGALWMRKIVNFDF